jgi:hypothetical protein
MKSKITIGAKVISNKSGKVGEITKIITKSTGYIVINMDGHTFSDMAHNYSCEDGSPLKAKPGAQSEKTIAAAVTNHARSLAEAEYFEHKF